MDPAPSAQDAFPIAAESDFYAGVPCFTRFQEVVDETRYRRLPDDWVVGVSDVISSTAAIEAGRYKAVNLVGASVIAAISNSLGRQEFPFAFGGDGASFAVPGVFRRIIEPALAAVQVWAREEMDLGLRVGTVPISDIRQAGLDVTVARFASGPNVNYAMFSGGGLAWAEAALKDGRIGIEPAPAGSRPDLTGLSCRWNPVVSRNGAIVSIIALPVAGGSSSAFANLVRDLWAIITERLGQSANPVSESTLAFSWPPQGIELETRVRAGFGSRWGTRIFLWGFTLFSWVLFRTGLGVGGFDPAVYKRQTVENTDFQKYSDRLELTLDCDDETRERLTARLERARNEGVAWYGVHAQREALITCIVPSAVQKDHIHFVDGAGGGYAEAASLLKAQMKAGTAPRPGR
jgi:hypothetical protein